MIVYGHRGAAFYAPENTMSSFFLGLQKGANGLETDIQRTRDGVLVLFHDDTVKRVLNQDGSISEYSFSQLEKMDFGNWFSPKYAGERIVKLQDFLYYFYQKPICLALEVKQQGIEQEVAEMLQAFGSRHKLAVTSFRKESLMAMRKIMPDQYLGFLTDELTEETFRYLKEYNIQEICPKADLVTPDTVRQAKERGYMVRAWGVKTRALMVRCADAGVDGMTVDFPDMLVEYLS